MKILNDAFPAFTRRSVGVLTHPQFLLATYTVTMFTSAMLLFSVQPMFAKMALPMLGGTPAVWAVSMCFFQMALLAGYCYAHALNRWLDKTRAVQVHIALLTLTTLALPIALPGVLADPPEGDAYFWLFGVLALGVGLPFFAVSASAPLLQAWFSETGHRDAADPYFLYGASNLGSLMALLAYPLVLEPTIGLTAQSMTWSLGFLILELLIVTCGIAMIVASAGVARVAAEAAEPAAVIEAKTTSWTERAQWIALAAIPSGLMVAVTTHITTDIASAPFIWVVPLALFLATFILVFRANLPFNYTAVKFALPVAAVANFLLPHNLTAAIISLVAFFLAAIVCHRELYMKRPEAQRLTEFYIWMSVGGVIGGMFSALVAPKIFTSVFEFKLLIIASLLAAPAFLFGSTEGFRWNRLAIAAAAIAAVLASYNWLLAEAYISSSIYIFVAVVQVIIIGVVMTKDWPEHRAIATAGVLTALLVMQGDAHTLYAERSFFGTIKIVDSDDGVYRRMIHGTTIHGAQIVRDEEGKPNPKLIPLTYYYEGSPMQRGIELVREARVASEGDAKVGVVGLGAGSLACFSKPGETWRYYEIDPMVARVAQDTNLFTFISKCRPNLDIVYGDARLTLRKETTAPYDYLLIDAFSSDSIPAHLLTRESFELYLTRLKPEGLLAIHISNRYLNLGPSIAATIETMPGLYSSIVFAKPDQGTLENPKNPIDKAANEVVFISRNPALIDKVKAWPDAQALEANGAAAWTDDFSDILSVFYRGLHK